MAGFRTAPALLVFALTILVANARYDYVKYGREDDGPFPSNLKNMPYYCYQNPLKGPCSGTFVVWFYDVVRRQCMQMIYSGCGGNENRFISKASCVMHCEKTRKI